MKAPHPDLPQVAKGRGYNSASTPTAISLNRLLSAVYPAVENAAFTI